MPAAILFNEEVFAFIMEYGSQYIKLRKHWKYEYEVIFVYDHGFDDSWNIIKKIKLPKLD